MTAQLDKGELLGNSITRHTFAGIAIVTILVGGLAVWASVAEISGAVIAPGALVVETNSKKVQHAEGGIVGEILARDGDVVKAGDIVVKLDATQITAKLKITTKAMDQLLAKRARLRTELENGSEIVYSPELLQRARQPGIAEIISAEDRIFKLRKQARIGQKSQLENRIDQYEQEVGGLQAQAKSKSDEIALIHRELVGVRSLSKKELVSISRLTQLERQATRIEGERAALVAGIAQTKRRISETQMQILQIDRDLGKEAATELGQISGRLGELEERKISAQDQLDRVDIRAPQGGIVHQSTVHTVGGVITSGEEIMMIVPRSDALTVEAKLAPRDIDQLHAEQKVRLRFSALNQRETPEINGSVARISADISKDKSSGRDYYTVRIDLDEKEVARLGNVALVPGMPVEAFIRTRERSVFSYLLKPLSDQLFRAFRAD